MIPKVFRLVFLFIICIKLTKGKSIADMTRCRNGEAFVQSFLMAWQTYYITNIEQTSENIFTYNDYKLRKGHLDLRILLECKKNNLIPKFLQFKLPNRHLHNSLVYKKCRIKLLEEKIRAKEKRINILKKDTKRIRKELQGTLSCLDFSYIWSLLLVTSDFASRKFKNGN